MSASSIWYILILGYNSIHQPAHIERPDFHLSPKFLWIRLELTNHNILLSYGTPLSHSSACVHVNTERRSESQHPSIKWYASESFLCMYTCKYRKKIRIVSIKWYASESFICMCTCKYRKKIRIRITTSFYQMVRLWVIPLYVYM